MNHECSNKFEFGLQLKKFVRLLKFKKKKKKISAGLGLKSYYDAVQRIKIQAYSKQKILKIGLDARHQKCAHLDCKIQKEPKQVKRYPAQTHLT